MKQLTIEEADSEDDEGDNEGVGVADNIQDE